MIIPMKKISIQGPKSEIKKTVDVLKSSGAFEISNLKKIAADKEESNKRKEELSASLERTKVALENIKLGCRELAAASKNDEETKKEIKASVIALDTVDEIEYEELKNVAAREAEILDIIDAVEAATAKQLEIKGTLSRNKALIKELVAYQELKFAFNTLADTKSTFVLIGIIAAEQFEQFRSDYDLSHIIQTQIPSNGKNNVVILIGHKEDYVIAHEIFGYGFERCKFNFSATASQKIKELEEINKELISQKTVSLRESAISPQDLKLLKTYYDYLCNEIDTEKVLGGTIQGESFFVLNGWIVGKDEERVVSLLINLSEKIQVQVSKPSEYDKPPAFIKNSPVVAPYGSITNLYSAPGPKDIDPNLFVAIFYFIFFGVMIGDIGYGILMSVIGFGIIIFSKPQKKGTRDLILLIAMGGISTILWGLLFGSFFGASTSEGILGKIFPSGVLNPIDNAMVFLGLTLGLGAVHIVVGLCLKFYNLIRQGKIVDAIAEPLPRIALFIGLAFVVLDMLVKGLGIGNIGIIIVVVAVVLICLAGTRKKKGIIGKFGGAFGALYSLINYFSDVLSYARLFGLGLVGAVIATVANSLGSMMIGIPVIGIVLAIVVALVFHIFNLAIGLLSAYVHNARLQFIEFFSKFYQGGGKQFIPMGSGLKYTKIKGVK